MTESFKFETPSLKTWCQLRLSENIRNQDLSLLDDNDFYRVIGFYEVQKDLKLWSQDFAKKDIQKAVKNVNRSDGTLSLCVEYICAFRGEGTSIVINRLLHEPRNPEP